MRMDLVGRAKMLWELFTKGGMTKADKLILVLAVLYTLSPPDIIPDVVPVVGFLDDLMVVIMSLRHVTNKHQAKQKSAENLKAVDVEVV